MTTGKILVSVLLLILVLAIGVIYYQNDKLSELNNNKNTEQEKETSVSKTEKKEKEIENTDFAHLDVGTYYADFNFDGTQDKLIVTRADGSVYFNYKIYVQTTSGNNILSDELTRLINGNSYRGSLRIDTARQRIITYGSSGAGLHGGSEYIVVPGKGLQEVFRVTEADGSFYGGEDVKDNETKVTTEVLVNGVWQKTVKIYNNTDNPYPGFGNWRNRTQF